jgi:hypothetical protein
VHWCVPWFPECSRTFSLFCSLLNFHPRKLTHSVLSSPLMYRHPLPSTPTVSCATQQILVMCAIFSLCQRLRLVNDRALCCMRFTLAVCRCCVVRVCSYPSGTSQCSELSPNCRTRQLGDCFASPDNATVFWRLARSTTSYHIDTVDDCQSQTVLHRDTVRPFECETATSALTVR